jgi:hypothetical protein
MTIKFEVLEELDLKSKKRTLMVYLELIEEFLPEKHVTQERVVALKKSVAELMEDDMVDGIYHAMRLTYSIAIRWNKYDWTPEQAHREFNATLVSRRRKEIISDLNENL